MREFTTTLNRDKVIAIRDGNLTQIRIPVKTQPVAVEYWKGGSLTNDKSLKYIVARDADGQGWCNCGKFKNPYGVPGDVLLVKETYWAWGSWKQSWSEKKKRKTWQFVDITDTEYPYLYDADDPVGIKRRNTHYGETC